MLMPHYGNIAVEHKGGENDVLSVVTALDREVERYLADKILALDPTATFAGEEYGGSRDMPRYWLCDPIDGTAHFVRGLPFCSVMLALVVEKQPQFSVIYDFVNDAMYHAVRDGGSFLNGRAIHVSERPLSEAFIAFETRMESSENREALEHLRSKSIIFHSVTSGFEYSNVASGKLDGRVCLNGYGKDYDFIPGALLVKEAGGVVANIGTDDYDITNLNFIASNRHVYDELTKGSGAVFPIAK